MVWGLHVLGGDIIWAALVFTFIRLRAMSKLVVVVRCCWALFYCGC